MPNAIALSVLFAVLGFTTAALYYGRDAGELRVCEHWQATAMREMTPAQVQFINELAGAQPDVGASSPYEQ